MSPFVAFNYKSASFPKRSCFYIPDQGMLQSKAATPSSTVVTQTTVAPTPTSIQHPSTAHSSTPNTHQQTSPATSTNPTPPVSSVQVPTYGKPRLLPSPYGPPPLPITITTSTETGGSNTGNGRGNSYRAMRNSNPPPKKIIPVSIGFCLDCEVSIK